MTSGSTGSLESLRRLNRLRVIGTLRDHGTVSRAEIARRTGLSRSTVSSLVADLQASGLVIEREASGRRPQGGRPPIMLSFDTSAGVAIGVNFDHRHLRVAVADLSSRLLAEGIRELDIDHQAEEGLDAAAALVDTALEEAGVDRMRVLGAGVGLPAPIDRATGIVGSSAILPGWVGVAPVQELRRRLGVPVLLDNDANLGALAEAAYGAGRGAQDFVYVMLSSGIGAGLILHGRLYRGSAGLAGELGHVPVNPDGPVCRCGNRGCLETAAAGPALVELLRRSHGDALTVREMLRLAHAGDHGCVRVLGDAGRAVGSAVAALCNVLNPSLLVVGGELAAGGRAAARRRPRVDRPLGAAVRGGGDAGRARGAGGPRRGPRRRGARRLRVRPALDAARGRAASMNCHHHPHTHQEGCSCHRRGGQGVRRGRVRGRRAARARGRRLRRRRRGRRQLERLERSREAREGRGAAAGLEVVGPLGDRRPAVPRRRPSTTPACRWRSRTPRATSPPSSSRPSRRSRTAPRSCCSSTSTPGRARRSPPTRSRATSRSSTTTA